MGTVEQGNCMVCGKKDVCPIERTYFRYDLECECHSPKHFEIVWHCPTCIPQQPTETKVVFKTSDLLRIADNGIAICHKTEWIDIGNGSYQNKVIGALFKDGKDGKPYYLDAISFNGNIGGRFTDGMAKTKSGETITSRQYVKTFPFRPKSFEIDVIDYRWKDKEETQLDENGDWWTHDIKDETQLKEVFEYYDKK